MPASTARPWQPYGAVPAPAALRHTAEIHDLQLVGEDTRSEDYETREQERSSTNLLIGQYISTTGRGRGGE